MGKELLSKNQKEAAQSFQNDNSTRQKKGAFKANAQSLRNYMHFLQSTIGNRAVVQMIKEGAFNGFACTPSAKDIQARENNLKGINVVQCTYKYDKKVYDPLEFKNLEGETADNKVSATYDSGLPTPYGVLKAHFGDQLNDDMFVSKKTYKIGDSFDRPHKISAEISAKKIKDRDDPPYVSGVGALGDEEVKIRQKENGGLCYAGGHLIGAKILGEGSMEKYNLAPQEERNNRLAYNNTIERALRDADKDCKYQYTVSLEYNNLNYEVDQGQLKTHGIIKEMIKDQPWVIQLPTRIPTNWTAKAELKSENKKFGSVDLKNKDKDTFDQYSQDMVSIPDDTIETRRARFNVSAKKQDDNVDNTSNADKLNFTMHQWTPTDKDRIDKPDDFTIGKTDYADVENKEETLDQLKKRLDYLEGYLVEISELDPKEELYDTVLTAPATASEDNFLESIKSQLNGDLRKYVFENHPDYWKRIAPFYRKCGIGQLNNDIIEAKTQLENISDISSELNGIRDTDIKPLESKSDEVEENIRKKIKDKIIAVHEKLSHIEKAHKDIPEKKSNLEAKLKKAISLAKTDIHDLNEMGESVLKRMKKSCPQ